MNRREENQQVIEGRISQEEPEPSPFIQVLAVLGFIVFLIVVPSGIDRLGK